uniref:Uncharacterized protein n=1 Tax=Strigamia maritima TaxID=126957 RepID=T1JM51_STRMM
MLSDVSGIIPEAQAARAVSGIARLGKKSEKILGEKMGWEPSTRFRGHIYDTQKIDKTKYCNVNERLTSDEMREISVHKGERKGVWRNKTRLRGTQRIPDGGGGTQVDSDTPIHK